MITDNIMDMLNDEIQKAIKLKLELMEHNQPDGIIYKQQGVIDGLQLVKQLLGDYDEDIT